MKDSAVGTAGLFDLRRQKRLLAGLRQRIESSMALQQELLAEHAEQIVAEEADLNAKRAEVTTQCRDARRTMLGQWDEAEELLTRDYETKAIKHRGELNRLGALYRRKTADEKKTIDRKVAARRQAVLQQFENRKNQPGQQKRKELLQIDESLTSIREQIEWARALTIRRLDHLPAVGPAETPEDRIHHATPETVRETLDEINNLTRRCKKVVNEMQTGAASKIVDSFYLPAGVAIAIVLWMVGVKLVGPDPPWIWWLAGIIGFGAIGIIIYLILFLPLKRMTRRLYPTVERLGHATDECAVIGRKIAATTATEAMAELVGRREEHLETAKRWKVEQVAALEKRLAEEHAAMKHKLTSVIEGADHDYTVRYATVGSEMRAKAESVAQKIKHQLSESDQSLQQIRQVSAAARHAQLQRLSHRLQDGVKKGLAHIEQSQAMSEQRHPNWSKLLSGKQLQFGNLDFLSLGWLRVNERLEYFIANAAEGANSNNPLDGGLEATQLKLTESNIPERLPIVLHRRMHSCVVLRAHPSAMNKAIEMTHQALWRLLCGAPPSRAKLTLIDPLGRGQHFTSFMALADHDPALVGHRVWTTPDKIEARLAELAHHVEDVLQASLRDRFERIEDFNEFAGSMAEPYRGIAAVGFPDGLSRDSYGHLRALVESGLRCGIFTILVCDKSKPWPSDTPMPSGDKVLMMDVDEDGKWTLPIDGLDELPVEPCKPPTASQRNELVERIGTAAVEASRVEVPLDNILTSVIEGKGSTADGISIAVGSQGANRSLYVDLGEGVRQHVLIAGKTGSGKSTLLHAIITSGAYYYRPDQLQFYLLDFKKGVEFKSYADSGIPHARVIGIESEREFGRSVLQRLDEELQQRGEKFRAAGVQELGNYRETTGQSMPRLMLLVDEFQELFVRDDRLAGDCAMLLDRLVRQGRSFGIHIILSSQSLAGAYSLPRATLGQMAVRIAMQCSEADAALILSDDNTAARLISRPGEAIYNDAGGLVEGNQPFQVAWLSPTRHREMLSSIAARDEVYGKDLPPPVIFEGNRPCRWTEVLADMAVSNGSTDLSGLLGESVEIGPPVSLSVSVNTGRNILLIAPAESRAAVLATAISGFAKSNPSLHVDYFDGSRVDDVDSLSPWLEGSGVSVATIKMRDCEQEMARISQLVKDRGEEAANEVPILVVVDPLDRFRDLRQDESYNFSLDAAGSDSGAVCLQNILRDGPPANVYVVLVCGSAEILSRWLPRGSQHDLELRILGQMNQSDSSQLIDSPIAAELSAATMLLYDDTDGRVTKFRQCDLPEPAVVKKWLLNLHD